MYKTWPSIYVNTQWKVPGGAAIEDGVKYPTQQLMQPETDETMNLNHEDSLNEETRLLDNGFILYKRRWLILAVFSLVSMTNEVIWISLSSITSIVKVYYHVDSIAVNWLAIIFMLLFIFVIGSSYILDRFGLRFTIIMGAALNATGSCLRCVGANRDGFALVFIGNTCAALAQSLIMFIPPGLAAAWFGAHERATASAIGVMMNLLGISVGFLMATIVPNSPDMEFVGKQMSILLVSQAVVCTLLLVLSVLFIEEKPPTAPSQSQALLLRLADKKTMQKIFEGKIQWTSNQEDNLKFTDDDDVDFDDDDDDKSSFKTTESSISQSTDVNIVNNATIDRIPSFRESILLLLKSKSFHLLCQSYSLGFGCLGGYNVVLNGMITWKYPGKEREIGYLGCAANLFGVVAMFFSGVWLDRSKTYRKLIAIAMALCVLFIVIFNLLLNYDDNFVILFFSFCVFGFFSFPFFSCGLEYAADIMYPISEGTTSCVIMFVGNIYAVIISNILAIVVRKGGANIIGYILAGFYAVSLALVLVNQPRLKRSQMEESARKLPPFQSH
eukprot:gene9021-9985_t